MRNRAVFIWWQFYVFFVVIFLRMLLFVFGDNQVLVKQKEKEIVNSFFEKYDGASNNFDNFFIEEKFDITIIRQAIKSPPFLAEKRMIILNGFCSTLKKSDGKQIVELLNTVSENNFIVCVDLISSKKMEKKYIFKELKDLKDVYIYKFDEFNGNQLFDWVKNRAKEMNLDISDRLINQLIDRIGVNTLDLGNEICKLAAYTFGSKCNEEYLLILTQISGQDEMFALMDAISLKNKSKVISLIQSQRISGSSDYHILSMLIRQSRILLSIKDSQEKFGNDKNKIAKITGIHSFVVQKSMRQTVSMSKQFLKEFHKICFDSDIGIKKGLLTPSEAIDIALVKFMH